jgi:hypothetical protein
MGRKLETSSPSPKATKLAQELVADRTGSSGNVRNRGASTRTNSDCGSTWRHKLDQPGLVRAERTHTSRLHRGWSGIHFEPVVDGAYENT